MGRCQEFIGVRTIEAANAFGEGKHLYNMRLTDTEIIRCRDCKWFRKHHKLSPFGDYYDYNTCGQIDGIRVRAIEPNGFCAWAERDE